MSYQLQIQFLTWSACAYIVELLLISFRALIALSQ